MNQKIRHKNEFELVGLSGEENIKQRALWRERYKFFIDKMFDKKPKLFVKVYFKYNGMNDNNGIHNHLTKYSHRIRILKIFYYSNVTTFFHELVHVWQCSTGILTNPKKGIKVYRGIEYDLNKTEYDNMPWEIEAKKIAKELVSDWNEYRIKKYVNGK